MAKSNFHWRLFAGFMIVIVVVTAAVEISVSRRMIRDSMQQIETSLLGQAHLLGALVQEDLSAEFPPDDIDHSPLQRVVEAQSAKIGARLTVIHTDGRVLADSDHEPSSMENHGLRPEVLTAAENGHGMILRYSSTLGERMMYVALAIFDGDDAAAEPMGYVRCSLPLTDVDARLSHLRYIITISALMGGLIAIAIAFPLARRITQPIRQITEAARGLTAGKRNVHLPVNASNEIGELARSFASMSEELSQRFDKLANERNKLSAILSGMVEGVIAVDREERILHINRAACELLEVEPEDCEGRPFWELFRLPDLSQALGDCLREKREQRREASRTRHGKRQIIELFASPLPGNGRAAGAVLVMHDISELRRLESLRRDFVANVSHELKTPLTAIRGLVETIQDDTEMPEDTRRDFLSRIAGQSDQLSKQVADLLTLSRQESAERVIQLEKLDLCELTRLCIGLLSGMAEQKRVELGQKICAEPLVLHGDRLALQQAIGNLIDNAIKYTSAGGKVDVALSQDDEHALLTVTDSGIGIEAKDRERIFERFFRVDRGRSREMGGTGLGLAIVKHVVLAHGGNISVASEVGRGSVFTVRLPL